MRSNKFLRLLLVLAIVAPACAQTVNLTNTVVNATPNKLGINIFSAYNPQQADYAKNFLSNGMNPGFEPQYATLLIALNNTAGTTTSFVTDQIADTTPSGFWVGGQACVVISETDTLNEGTCNTINGYTPPAGGAGGKFTFTTAWGAAIHIGDIIQVRQLRSPTTPADCVMQNGVCNWTTVSGGAQVSGEVTDRAADGGAQALEANATSGTVIAGFNFDSQPNNVWNLLNGTFTLKIEAKIKTGSPVLTVTGPVRQGASNGISCGTQTLGALTTSWAYYSVTCSGSEVDINSGNGSCVAGGTQTACTSPGAVNVAFTVTGGDAYLDNASMVKTGGDAANTTGFQDAFFHAAQTYCSGASLTGVPCVLRWFQGGGHNGNTFAMWTSTSQSTRSPASIGFNQSAGVGVPQVSIGLFDFLHLCQLVNATPYIVVPTMFQFTADYTSLMQYLGSATTSSGGGAVRLAQGQATPWTTVFPMIHLEMGEQNWDPTLIGQGLPQRTNALTFTDYQNTQNTLTAWDQCIVGGCNGGTPGGSGTLVSASQTIGNATPSLSGASMQLQMVVKAADSNALWTYKAAQNDKCRQFRSDFWELSPPDTATAVQNSDENDVFLFKKDTLWDEMFGKQCYYRASGGAKWQIENQSDPWVTKTSCTIISANRGIWHHWQTRDHFVDTDTSCTGVNCQHYDELRIDGVRQWTIANQYVQRRTALPSNFNGKFGYQHQHDVISVTGTQTVNTYVDNDNAYCMQDGAAPTPFYDYEQIATDEIQALQLASGYSQSKIDIVVNSANLANAASLSHLAQFQGDSFSNNGFTMVHIGNDAIGTALTNQAAEINNTAMNAADDTNLFQAQHAAAGIPSCGQFGTNPCGTAIPELSTVATACNSSSLTCPTQTVQDQFNAGGMLWMEALHAMLLQHAYKVPIAYMGMTGSSMQGGANGTSLKLPGACYDFRDDGTPRCRPQWFGLTLSNSAIIGQEVTCNLSTTPAFAYAGATGVGVNPPIPARSTQFLYTFCFQKGNNRTVAIYNTNQALAYTITFAGVNPPGGTVQQALLSPSAVTNLNEASSGADTTTTAMNTTTQVSTLTGFNPSTGVSIPAASMMVLSYTIGGGINPPIGFSGNIQMNNLQIP